MKRKEKKCKISF